MLDRGLGKTCTFALRVSVTKSVDDAHLEPSGRLRDPCLYGDHGPCLVLQDRSLGGQQHV